MNWDDIVRSIAMGQENKHWEYVLSAIMTADDKEYAKLYRIYADFIEAINRWNVAHKGITDVRFVRSKGK